MIKIISFDLDGTLMKTRFADLVWLEGLPKIYAKEKNIVVEQAKQYLQQEYDKMGDDKPEWYDLSYWFNYFNLSYDSNELLNEYKHNIETYPEVPLVLKSLSTQYDLIIISNARKEFIEIELEETRLKKYFTHVFSSTSDFKKVKKTTNFYSMICKKLQIKPYEMTHVGDHKDFDYYIPRNIGIIAFFLNRENVDTGEFIVHDLKDFKEKINKFLE